MRAPQSVKTFAKNISKTLVFLDIEHTGGFKASRCMTEFAAIVVAPSGEVSEYSSLVKLRSGGLLTNISTQLTGITRQMLMKEGRSLQSVADEFLIPHQDSVWIGFNSNSSDLPVIVFDCEACGIEFSEPTYRLDVMRLSPMKGSLSKQYEAAVPGGDTSGAHRAAKDALMTMELFDYLLPVIEGQALAQIAQAQKSVKSPQAFTHPSALIQRQHHLPLNRAAQKPLPRATTAAQAATHTAKTTSAFAQKTAHSAPQAPTSQTNQMSFVLAETPSFFAPSGTDRKGLPWKDEEKEWAKKELTSGRKIEEIADTLGRTNRSIAFLAHGFGLLTYEDAVKFEISQALEKRAGSRQVGGKYHSPRHPPLPLPAPHHSRHSSAGYGNSSATEQAPAEKQPTLSEVAAGTWLSKKSSQNAEQKPAARRSMRPSAKSKSTAPPHSHTPYIEIHSTATPIPEQLPGSSAEQGKKKRSRKKSAEEPRVRVEKKVLQELKILSVQTGLTMGELVGQMVGKFKMDFASLES